MKLTKKQKEVLAKISQGYTCCAVFPLIGKMRFALFNQTDYEEVSARTVLRLAYDDTNEPLYLQVGIDFSLNLTDLGKSIML